MIVVGFPLAVELDGGKRSQKAPLYEPPAVDGYSTVLWAFR